jgi:tetratricopeptide (TPR) repeat protein
VKQRLPFLILVAGIPLCLAALALPVDRGPFGGDVQQSEARVWETAGRIHAEGWSEWKQDPTGSPAYPLLLSPLAGKEIGAVRAARRVLCLVTLPLFALLGILLAWRGFGAWPAVPVGLGTVLVAPILLASGTFTPTVPAALFGLGTLLLLSLRGGTVSWILAGLLLALAVRFHPLVAWSLAVALCLLLLFRREPGTKRRLTGFLSALLLVTVALGATGRLGSAVPASLGIDLYRGHRAPASGVLPSRGDRDARRWWGYTDYLREGSRIKKERLSNTGGALFWGERALLEAAMHPLAELRRGVVKFLATFQGDPGPSPVGAAFLIDRAENPWPLRAACWAGRMLLPLGGLGILVGLRRAARGERSPTIGLLAAGVFSGWLAGCITFVEGDLRLVVVLCLLGGLAPLSTALRHTSAWWRWGAAGAAAILVFGLLPSWGAVPGLGIRGQDYLEMGALYDREGRGSAAMREYERTLRAEPDNPYPRLAIAGMLAKDNVRDQAIAELEHLREGHPDFVPGLLGLASLYQAGNQWVEAAAVYAELAKQEPWNPEHLNNLGTMYVQVGYYDQATRALEAAILLDPSYKLARDNLESLRARGLAPGAPAGADSLRIVQEGILARIREGDLTAARTALDAAYARFGSDNVELKFLEGTLFLVAGDAPRAIPLLEVSVEHMSQSVPVIANLATAYLRAGRYEDAKRTYKRALKLQPTNLQVQQALKSLEAVLDSLNRSGH